MSKSRNLTAVTHKISAAERGEQKGHQGAVIWLTGLSGAGKSTLAMALDERLHGVGRHSYVLDGDNVRGGLNVDLGFKPEDREENIRRVGEVAALFADAGTVCVVAFISPYRMDRDRARKAAGERFFEVYVKADVATCEERDPKGLYKKARAGEIPDFTGISAPYEEPEHADLVVDTAAEAFDDCLDRLAEFVEQRIAL